MAYRPSDYRGRPVTPPNPELLRRALEDERQQRAAAEQRQRAESVVRMPPVDTSFFDRRERDEQVQASLAMTPGVRSRGMSIVRQPPSPGRALSLGDSLDAIKPVRFTRAGQDWEFDPRAAAAQETALELGREQQRTDFRVGQLVEQGGITREDATRMVLGRVQATPDERMALEEQRQQGRLAAEEVRSTSRMERDRALSADRYALDQQRLAAQEKLQTALEAVRSGDRAKSRELQAALGEARLIQSELSRLDRMRREYALPENPYDLRRMQADPQGQRMLSEAEAALAAINAQTEQLTDRRGELMPGTRPTAPAVAPARPPAAAPAPAMGGRGSGPGTAPGAYSPSLPTGPMGDTNAREVALFQQARAAVVARGEKPTLENVERELARLRAGAR